MQRQQGFVIPNTGYTPTPNSGLGSKFSWRPAQKTQAPQPVKKYPPPPIDPQGNYSPSAVCECGS